MTASSWPKLIAPEKLCAFGRNLVTIARRHGIKIKVFGGIGVRLHCPLMQKNGFGCREYRNEIDIVVSPEDVVRAQSEIFGRWPKIEELRNYSGNFQAYALSVDGTCLVVEAFFGPLAFNHRLPEPDFSDNSICTLSVTELLLSKLAIVSLSIQDIVDIAAILAEHRVTSIRTFRRN